MKLTYIINERFEELMTSFCDFVLAGNVSTKMLKLGLRGIVRQPTIYEDDEIVTSTQYRYRVSPISIVSI